MEVYVIVGGSARTTVILSVRTLDMFNMFTDQLAWREACKVLFLNAYKYIHIFMYIYIYIFVTDE